MAERRMFSKSIIDSDVFLDMPLSTQALYFHLSMRADDEGFISNPKKVMRMIGASQNEFEILVAKRYLLTFESGIVVIKHWRIHNYIQKDRMKKTLYEEEKQMLTVKENKSYTDNMDTKCIQNGDIGKVRLGKVSIEETNIREPKKRASRFTPPSIKQVKEYCTERQNTVNPEKFIDYYLSKGWLVGKTKMKDWKASVRNWERSSFNTAQKVDQYNLGEHAF